MHIDCSHVLLSSGIELIENLTNDQVESKLFRCGTIEMFAVIAFDFIKVNYEVIDKKTIKYIQMKTMIYLVSLGIKLV